MTVRDSELPLKDKALRLWVADPAAAWADPDAPEVVAVLSADEQARLQSFRFTANRREFLAAHLLVRHALSHETDRAPKTWRFRVNAFGKPAIDPDCGLRFNLSRRAGLAVCLVAQGVELGVDVEALARGAEILAIAGRIFSPKEIEQLEEMSKDRQPEHALTLWTLKEAYSKACGLGLSLPLREISFLWNAAEGLRLKRDGPIRESDQRWRFCVIDHAGHRIALVAESCAEPRLELWGLSAFGQAPTRLGLDLRPVWFPSGGAAE